MRKDIVFILIFFLFFSTYFNLAKARSLSVCDGDFNVDSGTCTTDIHFGPVTAEETGTESQGTIGGFNPQEIMRQTSSSAAEFSTAFLTLAFQFFSIVILFILLVVLLESIIGSK